MSSESLNGNRVVLMVRIQMIVDFLPRNDELGVTLRAAIMSSRKTVRSGQTGCNHSRKNLIFQGRTTEVSTFDWLASRSATPPLPYGAGNEASQSFTSNAPSVRYGVPLHAYTHGVRHEDLPGSRQGHQYLPVHSYAEGIHRARDEDFRRITNLSPSHKEILTSFTIT